MERISLAEKLLQYGKSGACPMHMPGHKRTSPFPWMETLARMDLTEIDGFDNLHGAEGILKEGMERMARLWGSRRSFFLVNGSTCGILAGIRSLTRPGDSILMARNCHKSVYHAVELNQLRPVYLAPETDEETGISGSIRSGSVEAALAGNPDIRLAVITSPTYEGVISDVESIAGILHRKEIPLLVDEAHGAHLGFSEAFSGGAVKAGADLVVQSLHKTLPSLTQTASIHVCGDLADGEELARQLSVFETSSPSYLLMASIDSCVRLLEERGEELFQRYDGRLEEFGKQVLDLGNLRVLGYGKDTIGDHPLFWGWDRSKLILLTAGTDITGPALARRLRREFQIELEMALGGYGLAMTSLCDSEESLGRLAKALLAIDRELSPVEAAPLAGVSTGIPLRQAYVWELRGADTRKMKAQEAAGKVAAEYMWAYPPGIPLVVPGEQISEEMLFTWRKMENSGVELKSTSGAIREGCLLLLA